MVENVMAKQYLWWRGRIRGLGEVGPVKNGIRQSW